MGVVFFSVEVIVIIFNFFSEAIIAIIYGKQPLLTVSLVRSVFCNKYFM